MQNGLPSNVTDAGPDLPLAPETTDATDVWECLLEAEICCRRARNVCKHEDDDEIAARIQQAREWLESAEAALRARRGAYEAAQDPDAGREDFTGEEQ